MTHQEPTIASILRRLADEFDGPVEEQLVLEQVLERRPSSAKNPYATIRERLRWDGLTLGWLRLNRRQLVPLRIALQGLRFRCIPRSRDVERGLLPLAHLQPFAGLRGSDLTLVDEHGQSLRLIDPEHEPAPSGVATPSFDLDAWYARRGFQAGDSLLVSTRSAEPLVLQIERERAEDFRYTSVAAQDTELLEAIVERVVRAQVALIPCDEVVLPIFAASAWRTAYPGLPWQALVTRDGRLQLVDDIFLTSQRHPSLRLFSSEEVFAPPPASEPDQRASEAALLREIDTLQQEIRSAREQAADAGIWDGQLQRASSSYGAFERLAGEIDDPREARSGELNDSWPELDWGGADVGEELDIDPHVLADARVRLLAALPAEAAERLLLARPEEAEVIIAAHLNMLLVREPSLFPRLELELPDAEARPGSDTIAEMLTEENWELSWDDDDELVDATDDDDSLEDELEDSVYAYSGSLIAQFHDYLAEIGKSAATARARARGLHVYAEFLASYYGRTLAEGDYATLDECLFFYYPRRVMNTSPRQAREICTAIKQFYTFLQQRGMIEDLRFAEAIWRRREQAARVVSLYERLASDSPAFERLFERLFWPYTE